MLIVGKFDASSKPNNCILILALVPAPFTLLVYTATFQVVTGLVVPSSYHGVRCVIDGGVIDGGIIGLNLFVDESGVTDTDESDDDHVGVDIILGPRFPVNIFVDLALLVQIFFWELFFRPYIVILLFNL